MAEIACRKSLGSPLAGRAVNRTPTRTHTYVYARCIRLITRLSGKFAQLATRYVSTCEAFRDTAGGCSGRAICLTSTLLVDRWNPLSRSRSCEKSGAPPPTIASLRVLLPSTLALPPAAAIRVIPGGGVVIHRSVNSRRRTRDAKGK